MNDAETLIATRKGIDPFGHHWNEMLIAVDDDTYRIESRSDRAEDCFDVDIDVTQVLDYMMSAVVPFVFASEDAKYWIAQRRRDR